MSSKEKGEKPERERSGRSRRESKADNGNTEGKLVTRFFDLLKKMEIKTKNKTWLKSTAYLPFIVVQSEESWLNGFKDCLPILYEGPRNCLQLRNTGYFFHFFDPCGRYGRFYGVTAQSKMAQQ